MTEWRDERLLELDRLLVNDSPGRARHGAIKRDRMDRAAAAMRALTSSQRNDRAARVHLRRHREVAVIFAVLRRETGVSFARLLERRTPQRINRFRQMAMLAVREIAGYSLPEIGKLLHKHHTTVMYGIKQAELMVQSKPHMARLLDTIRREATGDSLKGKSDDSHSLSVDPQPDSRPANHNITDSL